MESLPRTLRSLGESSIYAPEVHPVVPIRSHLLMRIVTADNNLAPGEWLKGQLGLRATRA